MQSMHPILKHGRKNFGQKNFYFYIKNGGMMDLPGYLLCEFAQQSERIRTIAKAMKAIWVFVCLAGLLRF